MYSKHEAPMFKLLTTFESVYRTRSFTSSAEELFYSQPTISKHINKLEDMLGEELFIRQGANKLIPTDIAEKVYEVSKNILGQWNEIIDEIQTKKRNIPYISIGVSHTFASIYLVPLIKHLFEINNWKINFDIQVINSTHIIDQLKENKIDLGFIEKPLKTNLVNYHQLMEDKLVLAGNLDSNLWLIREIDSGVRHYTEKFIDTHNIHDTTMKVNNNNTVLKLLESGIGKSIISKKLVKNIPYKELSSDYTRYFYLVESNIGERNDYIIEQILDYFLSNEELYI